MPYYVYILCSKPYGTFYTGMTNDLVRRIYEHKNKLIDGFTKKYDVSKLAYYEIFEDAENAIIREKQIKAWKRQWKINHILEVNSDWRDLYEDICQ